MRSRWVAVQWALALAILGTAPAAGNAARLLYVDDDAPGANTGTSWKDAFWCLHDALAAAQSGDEIRVAGGTYKPDQHGTVGGRFGRIIEASGDRTATFQLKSGVALRGGYAGAGRPDPNARDVKAYATILSGDVKGNDADVNEPKDLLTEPTRSDNSFHVVTGTGTDASAAMDGFTIRGGGRTRRQLGEEQRRGHAECTGKPDDNQLHLHHVLRLLFRWWHAERSVQSHDDRLQFHMVCRRRRRRWGIQCGCEPRHDELHLFRQRGGGGRGGVQLELE